MKIVHITHHYNDSWGYQDNLLPLYQQKAGDDVVVISDINHLPSKDRAIVLEKGGEYYDGPLRIIRIKCYGNTSNTSLFCSGLYQHLKHERPDLIFHHGVDSSTLVVSSIYKMLNPKTVLFVDNHADVINMSKNKLWHFVYEKVWLSLICKIISPFVSKYYGVSQLRCEYLHKVFRIPTNKISFLPLGGDTDRVDRIKETRMELRDKFGIPKGNYVIVSGGKMSASKGTLSLINAYHNYKVENPKTTLVLFGMMDEKVQQKANTIDGVITFGWCDREQTLSLLKLADVAVWPLLHTTLIEDAISCGTPIIIRKSGNVSHLEKEENGIYMVHGDEHEIKVALASVRSQKYKDNAMIIKEKYSYRTISKSVADDYKMILQS